MPLKIYIYLTFWSGSVVQCEQNNIEAHGVVVEEGAISIGGSGALRAYHRFRPPAFMNTPDEQLL
jgi:hypothetical protein